MISAGTSRALYWVGVKAYELAVHIAALWNEKAAAAVLGRRDLLKKIAAAMRSESRPRIWMHCASLGEFEQGRPVLEALRKECPQHAFVLTFFSPSGYRVRKDWDGVDYVFYLPFDGAARAKKLVEAIKPSLAIWVKYEFWYFTLRALKNAGVPTVLIAAFFSKSAPAFQWWGSLHRRMVRGFDWIFTQDEASLAGIRAIGVSQASSAGDPRYDRVFTAAVSVNEIDKAERFTASAFTIVAGSTWPADEAVIEGAMRQLSPEVKLLLVPHEVDEAHLQAIESRFEKDCIRWSQWSGGNTARVLLVDSVGMLMQLYRYADIAYVGGGFGRSGVHNVLEPAAHGIPVIIGPEYHAYREAVELVERGVAQVVEDEASLADVIRKHIENTALRDRTGALARQAVEDGAGATQKILAVLREKILPTSDTAAGHIS
jgi:3-deoxy-D-manno-octulosonic-acid transferase